MLEYQFSDMVNSLKRSEIREIFKLTRKPDIISFAGGLPDPSIFPYEKIKESAKKTIDERGKLALQYGPTDGDPFFKEQLVGFMKNQGEDVKSDDIVIISSSQQGLDLLSKMLINPGDPIILEMPSYIGGIQSFRAFRADFHGVRMDFEGIIPELLEEKIKLLSDKGKKPKFLYLIPDFQNPSGITLTMKRRKSVLEIASKYDLLIIEDSPYRELRFEGELLPSLFSLDKEDRVVYLKTFSKILSPGLRLGWVVGPKPVLEKMIIAKQSADLCTSPFLQIMTAYFIKSGYLEKQIEKSKELYKEKAGVMFDSLEKYMPDLDGLSWSEPEGGMFMWIKLPEYMKAMDMFQKAVDMKVAYLIGEAFYYDASGKNTMRLNYSFPTVEQIKKGVERLANLIKEYAK